MNAALIGRIGLSTLGAFGLAYGGWAIVQGLNLGSNYFSYDIFTALFFLGFFLAMVITRPGKKDA